MHLPPSMPDSSPYRRAELYAALHSGNPGDVAHYVQVCRGAHDVLELGAGNGRIARALAEHGLDVTGVEIDAEMLELAQSAAGDGPPDFRRRLHWLRGDMRNLQLQRSFDRVLLPYNGLYCLGGQEGALACFEAVARHLTPDGELWLDVYEVDAFHAEATPDDESEHTREVGSERAPAEDPDDEPVAELDLGGRLLVVFEDTRWSRSCQKLEVTYRFYDRDEEVARQSIDHHYLLARQILELMEQAGLEVFHSASAFVDDDPDPENELLVLGARRRRTL